MQRSPRNQKTRFLLLLPLSANAPPKAARAYGEVSSVPACFHGGDAAGERTPRVFGQGQRWAACAGASLLGGAQVFSLKKPCADREGDGRYDAGEPCLDRPTADGATHPPAGRWHGKNRRIWLDVVPEARSL